MAVTTNKYTAFPDHLAQKRIDLDTDDIRCVLMATYTPSAAHDFLSAVLAAGTEAAGTGYTAGGKSLTGVTWSQASGTWTLNGSPLVWSATGGALTARYAIFVDYTPASNATRPLIGYWNLNGGADMTATNDTFTLTPHASGFLTIT